MIRVEKAGLKMEVRTQVQASAFLKNGWTICEEASDGKTSTRETSDSDGAYSKTIINRMPISELRLLAEKECVPDFGEKTGAELKKALIQKFGL